MSDDDLFATSDDDLFATSDDDLIGTSEGHRDAVDAPSRFGMWSGWGFFVVTIPGMFLLGLALYALIT